MQKQKQVTCETVLDADTHEKLMALAKADHGRKRSPMIRIAVEEYVAVHTASEFAK